MFSVVHGSQATITCGTNYCDAHTRGTILITNIMAGRAIALNTFALAHASAILITIIMGGVGWGGVGWGGVGWGGVGWGGVGWGGVGWGGVGWRGVAWRGVGWGGVAWRGVAWGGVGWGGVCSRSKQLADLHLCTPERS